MALEPVKFEWAVNKLKLNRAILFATQNGQEGNEEFIKARYEALGGLTLGGLEKAREPKKPKIAEMTIEQLKEVAATNNVDLTGCTTKAKILFKLEEEGIDDEA